MKPYFAIFRMKFINTLQYRTAAVAGMVTQLAWGVMQLLAFHAFFQSGTGETSMSFSQTVSYIWLQQAFLSLFMAWFFDQDIFNAIASGNIAYDLARPVDLYSRWFCQSAATRLAKVCLRCIPVLLVALIMPPPLRLTIPRHPLQLLYFVISMAATLGVVVSVNMIIYISAFYTISPAGMRIIAMALVDFLAGSTIPLPFFPQSIRAVINLLPFAAMQNIPLRIFSEHIVGIDCLHGILFQLFWLVVLVGIGKLMMKRGISKVTVQGG